jgi:hypothetical protein
MVVKKLPLRLAAELLSRLALRPDCRRSPA